MGQSAARIAVDAATYGTVAGRILDALGRPVAGSRVVVERAAGDGARASQGERTGLSGKDGGYLVAWVTPGRYWVTASAAGFQAAMAVTIEAGGVTAADVRLVLPVTETLLTVEAAPVELAGWPPQVPAQTDADDDPARAGRRQLEMLQADGSAWGTLALLLPETTGGDGPDGGAAISFRGLAVTQNGSEIDGVSDEQRFGAVAQGAGGGAGREAEDANDAGSTTGVGGDGARAMYGRHAGAAYTFAQGAVQEFRVNTGAYSALDGHAAGGVATTVSKSGTNAVRGNVFYLARDSAWGATNPFSVVSQYRDGVVTSGMVKPSDLRQQFGGVIGGPVNLPEKIARFGPVKRGSMFYFAAVDVQRRANPAVSSPGYADFYALTATQQALLANRGVSRDATGKALSYLDSLTGTVARREDQTIAFGKLDWDVSPKDRVSVEENSIRWDSPGGVRSEPVVERGVASLGNSYGKIDAGVARWVRQAISTLSNELRLAYSRDFEYETPLQPLPQELAIGPGGLAPEVSIGPNGFTFGTPAALGRKAYPDERRAQAAEMVSWIHGRHLLQAGFDFSEIHDRIDALANQEGTFRYDSGATNGKAGGLVDWITDYTFSAEAYPNGACPSIVAAIHRFCFRTYTQSFGQSSASFDTQEWAGFVQDGWQATSTLRLSAGLRYEYEREPAAQRPNAGLDALFGARGATSVFPSDKNNLGPRFGIAWEPLGVGKGTVRAGYGVYFGRLPGGMVRAALLDTALPGAGSSMHVRITPATETDCPQVANQGFGYGCAYGTGMPPAAVSATSSATVFDRRFRLPMVQQGSFGIEREMKGGVTVSAAYAVNLDRQLPDSVDINIAPSIEMGEFQLQGGPVNRSGPNGVANGETFVVPVYTDRISTLYGPVTDIVSNANGTYHALVLEATRRSRKGLEFRASWTWAKAIDTGANDSAVPLTNGQFDPFTVGYDKGLSELNLSHKVTASAVWEPALATPRRWQRRLANGWTLSPLFQETSGRPYSYEIFGGRRLTGGHTSINGSGGAVYLPTVGRNTLRLPETAHLDLRVAREVRITERVRLRAAAEVFNLPNHVNYTSTTTRAYQPGVGLAGVTPLVFQDAATVAAEGLNEQPFGAFTASSTSNSRERQLQFGVKIQF